MSERRDYVLNDVVACRRLLPGWLPTLEQLQGLDARSSEHTAALRAVARGWGPNDSRWDVLLTLFEYERRQHAHALADEIRAYDAEAISDDAHEIFRRAADLIDPEVGDGEAHSG